MKKAPELTAERLREVLHYCPETGKFTWKKPTGARAKAGSVCDRLSAQGYIQIGVDGKQHLAHRLAWLYVYGNWPTNLVDHIDRDQLNNRITNLRLADRQLNGQNAKVSKKNTSGWKGVSWDGQKGKWAASITVMYRSVHLGRYSDIESAVAARRAAEAKYHPFAARDLHA